MSTRTERLYVELSGNSNGLVSASKTASNALRSLEKQTKVSTSSMMKSFGSLNGLVGGISFAGLVAGAKAALESAAAIGRAAEQAGLSAQNFQELAGAAKLAGIEQETMASVLSKLQVHLGQASQGVAEQANALNSLGVTSTDTNTAIMEIADGLRAIPDPAERAALASKVLGEEAGPKLLALLSQGSAALAAQRAEIVTLTDVQVQAAKDIDREYTALAETLKTRVKGAAVETASAMDSLVKKTGLWLSSIGAGPIDTLEELQARSDGLRGSIERTTAAMEGSMAKGNAVYRESLERSLANERAKLAAVEELIVEKQSRSGILRGPQVAPDGTPVEPNLGPNGARAPSILPKLPAFHSKEEAGKAESAAKAAEAERKRKAAELEREQIAGARMMQDVLEDAAKARDAEREAIEKQSEKMRDFTQSVAADFTDLAIRGSSAADQLKRKVIEAILTASIQTLGGGKTSGKSGLLGFGLTALGALAGASDLFNSGTPAINSSGGVGSEPYLPGRARGGTFRVGGALGATDSKYVPMRLDAGELVQITPRGQAGMGGKVEQNVDVIINNLAPGVDVTQERRRAADGREQIQIAVRAAMREEVARRGPAAGAILSDAGARRAPRSGIS